VYTDRDSMFTVATRPGESEQERREADRLTQIGRALRELRIGWIAAYSPQAKGRVERSFGTDQDRLVKELRLAGVTTLQAANRFLETQYWPEWNARFARSLEGVVDMHRPLTPEMDLASALSHVEQRVIRNDYTVSFAGKNYQMGRKDVKSGMKGQRLRMELHLDGALRARYEGRYVELAECGVKTVDQSPPVAKSVRKDHNAGGKSRWMEGFFDRPGPALWQAVRSADSRS